MTAPSEKESKTVNLLDLLDLDTEETKKGSQPIDGIQSSTDQRASFAWEDVEWVSSAPGGSQSLASTEKHGDLAADLLGLDLSQNEQALTNACYDNNSKLNENTPLPEKKEPDSFTGVMRDNSRQQTTGMKSSSGTRKMQLSNEDILAMFDT